MNDPDIQREKFTAQLQGIDDEESTFRTLDEDFLESLKVGMPPAGGMGLGNARAVARHAGLHAAPRLRLRAGPRDKGLDGAKA